MTPLLELEAAYRAARRDPAFRERVAQLSREYVGRPTPLTFAERLTEHAGGARIYLKREDLCHTGAHKINNTLGQGLLAARMGKPRVIAETGAGQHGVATATIAALLGLECEVYMGEEDTRAPGAERLPDGAPRGARDPRPIGQPHAQGRDERGDPRLGHQRPDDLLLHRVHRRPASVPDDGPRPPVGHRARGAAAARRGSRTCSSPAWAAGPTPSASSTRSSATARSAWSASRRRAPGSGAAATRRRSRRAFPGVLHGSLSYVIQDEDGQILPAHSISAGLDYPGVGPEHSWLQRHRPGRVRRGDRRGGAGGARPPHAGSRASSRRSSRRTPWPTRVRLAATLPREARLVIGLSGRGDKDVDTVRAARAAAPGAAGRETGEQPCRALTTAFARLRRQGERALVPYFCAGDPSLEVTARLIEEADARGADVIEVGAALLRSPGGRSHDPARRRPRARAGDEPLPAPAGARRGERPDPGAAGAHDLPQPAPPVRARQGRRGISPKRGRRRADRARLPDRRERGRSPRRPSAAALDLIALGGADQRAGAPPADRAGESRLRLPRRR